MLSIENITAGYDDKLVLQDVSMAVSKGQFIGLIGPNGSGKTTLLRVISGILKPAGGRVLFEGTNLRKINKRKLAARLACLSQDISLDFSFTVRQIVLMGRSPHLSKFGTESKEDLEIAERAMVLADVSHLADRFISETSGGERQRSLIAMCLAQEPKLLLLDEPTSHLDIGHQLSVLELLKKLNLQNNLTVIAVLHDLNLAAEYCQKVLVLNRGRVEAFGTAWQVFSDDMVEKIYGAKVLTERNPISDKPHIILAAGMNDENNKTQNHPD